MSVHIKNNLLGQKVDNDWEYTMFDPIIETASISHFDDITYITLTFRIGAHFWDEQFFRLDKNFFPVDDISKYTLYEHIRSRRVPHIPSLFLHKVKKLFW